MKEREKENKTSNDALEEQEEEKEREGSRTDAGRLYWVSNQPAFDPLRPLDTPATN